MHQLVAVDAQDAQDGRLDDSADRSYNRCLGFGAAHAFKEGFEATRVVGGNLDQKARARLREEARRGAYKAKYAESLDEIFGRPANVDDFELIYRLTSRN